MTDYVTKYAKMVQAGEIAACEKVRLACRRHLEDLKKSRRKEYPYYFDPAAAQHHFDFFTLCRHYKGEKANQPVELELWQKFVNGSVFGWLDKKTGLRRFRVVYEQVARKNGKSTKAAGVGLYCLTMDGEQGAEIYSAATKKDQARIILETAQQMVKKSPALRKYLGVYRANIYMETTASKMEAVSSDADTLDGLNIHCALIDELHAHKTRAVYDVMTTATGARRQPLIWVVTTAGSITNGICKERYDYAAKVLNGVIEDETLFAYIAELDAGDDPFEEKNWIKANPNLGVSVKTADLRRKAKEARELSSAYNNFLCKHMDMWVTAEESWMNMLAYRECGMDLPGFVTAQQLKKPEDIIRHLEEYLIGTECYVGVDLSAKLDLTSVTFEFPLPNGFYAVLSHSFIPENRIPEKERTDNVSYSGWVRDGYITAIPGDVIELSWVEEYIQNMAVKYFVKEICYDPWNATEFANHMTDEGFTCVEIRQGFKTMSEPTKDIEKLVVQHKLIHGCNPVLAWAVSNAVARYDPAGNVKLDKAKSKMRIDPVISLVTSHARAMTGAGGIDLESYISNGEFSL